MLSEELCGLRGRVAAVKHRLQGKPLIFHVTPAGIAVALIRRQMRVLIIDDDPIFCRYLGEVLTQQGHAAEWVSDGLVGFERCLRRSYDVVICDVRMPLISGTELVAELQRDRPKQHVVLISAFPDDQLVAQARQYGAQLLSKPFDAAILEGILDQIADDRTSAREAQTR